MFTDTANQLAVRSIAHMFVLRGLLLAFMHPEDSRRSNSIKRASRMSHIVLCILLMYLHPSTIH